MRFHLSNNLIKCTTLVHQGNSLFLNCFKVSCCFAENLLNSFFPNNWGTMTWKKKLCFFSHHCPHRFGPFATISLNFRRISTIRTAPDEEITHCQSSQFWDPNPRRIICFPHTMIQFQSLITNRQGHRISVCHVWVSKIWWKHWIFELELALINMAIISPCIFVSIKVSNNFLLCNHCHRTSLFALINCCSENMINMMVGVNHVTDGLFRPTSHQFVDVRTENNRPNINQNDRWSTVNRQNICKAKDKEELRRILLTNIIVPRAKIKCVDTISIPHLLSNLLNSSHL
mmetsp:Transcript_17100/g.23702  ORF Transcript_17100/g.23702 Transcript_17100/m.23702 type:complete len:287 (+) Transcript_17100:458-1318(+)